MSEFRVNSITNQDGSAGPQVCGVSTFSGKSGVQIPSGPTEFRRQDGGGRGRGIFDSGGTPSSTNVIDMIEIATMGDAIDFGNMSVRCGHAGSVSSSTRGVVHVTYTPSATYTNGLEYITISSGGGVNDFGERTVKM